MPMNCVTRTEIGFATRIMRFAARHRVIALNAGQFKTRLDTCLSRILHRVPEREFFGASGLGRYALGGSMRLQTVPSAATLLGKSPVHLHVLDTLDRVAATDAEVLISGATGSGKELYAIYLHQRSHRSKAPFIPVNCGGLPSDLIENELFGHVGGAFTGARPQSAGLVAEAEGGTLFLDEVETRCRWRRRRSCCVSCRKRSIAGSARHDCGGPTCASSPQRMPTSRRR